MWLSPFRGAPIRCISLSLCIHIYIYIYIHICLSLSLSLHIYIYIYTHVLYIYTYICICIIIHTHIYIYIYICPYIHTYIYIYICLYYIHICIYMYISPFRGAPIRHSGEIPMSSTISYPIIGRDSDNFDYSVLQFDYLGEIPMNSDKFIYSGNLYWKLPDASLGRRPCRRCRRSPVSERHLATTPLSTGLYVCVYIYIYT